MDPPQHSRANQLNGEQRQAYDSIMRAALNPESEQRLFYVQGCAGSGKTFLFNILGEDLSRQGITTTFSALCGIAAQPLPLATTCHTRYGIPKTKPTDGRDPKSNSSLETDRSAILFDAHVHFIDEVSMMKSWQFQVVNEILKVSS